MKKLLIASNISNSYGLYNIYQVESNVIKPIKIHDSFELISPNYFNYKIKLPIEIVYMIVDQLIYIYLKNGSFEYAADLITFDKDTIKRFYRKYFENLSEYSPITAINYRISRSLHLCYTIFEFVVGQNFGMYQHFTIDVYHRSLYAKCCPWDTDSELLSIFPSEPHNLRNYPNYKVFRTGPSSIYQIWIQGSDYNGIVHASFVRYPILVIALINQEEETICLEQINFAYFEKFSNILRIAFGKNSGIFLQVANPYDGIIEVIEL